MFRASTIRDVELTADAAFVQALVGKLLDVDRHRIASNDQLVIRKAVLGLLEVVAGLEARIAALEDPTVVRAHSDRLASTLSTELPEYVTGDDKETATPY